MEKENWIETILNSINGITQVEPSETLYLKIKHKIEQQQYASTPTVWLAAASIALLMMLNLAVIKAKTNQKETTEIYFESTLNQSNQLY